MTKHPDQKQLRREGVLELGGERMLSTIAEKPGSRSQSHHTHRQGKENERTHACRSAGFLYSCTVQNPSPGNGASHFQAAASLRCAHSPSQCRHFLTETLFSGEADKFRAMRCAFTGVQLSPSSTSRIFHLPRREFCQP